MKATIAIMAFLTSLAVAGPVFPRFPATDGDSGCYFFEDPDCGIDYAVCQCANGCFYYNDNNANCQPPGSYAGCSEGDLPGYTCG